jgi:hypothetical protein|tara:strand:- start:656 stop:916 length:261 start_codon:yes stop_codon:yes gene_type:complete
LIFSFLKLRKKTSAILSGIIIGAGSLWGLTIWQNISREELFSILLATLAMLGSIILAALILISVLKTIARLLSKIGSETDNDEASE